MRSEGAGIGEVRIGEVRIAKRGRGERHEDCGAEMRRIEMRVDSRAACERGQFAE